MLSSSHCIVTAYSPTPSKKTMLYMNLLLLSLVSTCSLVLSDKLDVLYSWKLVDFTFDSESLREENISSGRFIAEENIIADVDVWKGANIQKVFVTIAKFKAGVPATLATVANLTRGDVRLLKPYPDWSWHTGTCDGIFSVYRVKVDTCNRLWVLDSGVLLDTDIVCPPKILIFDLQTDTLIRKHVFPSSLLSCNTNLITIEVDTRGNECGKSVAYVADVAGFKLLVYDYATDQSWAVKHDYFYPYPPYGRFQINGVTLDFMDGIFGLALGPECEDRLLYCHSMASVHEVCVRTKVVSNMTLFINNTAAPPRSIGESKGTRQSQSSDEAMSDSGILFYALVAENAIGCWNTKLSLNKMTVDIVVKNDTTLQFISGLKIYGDEIWLVSNRLQNFVNDNVAVNETNYRILVGSVKNLVKNTRCEIY